MSIAATHIEVRNNRAGQPRAYVVGSRTRVMDIYALVELQGATPSDLAEAFPHLSAVEIQAALAYLADHRDAIVCQFNEEEALVEKYRAAAPPGLLEKYLQQRHAGRDPLSPG